VLNTALIIHLLARVQHLVAGHHFRTWIYAGCFLGPHQHLAHVAAPALQHISHRASCLLVTVRQRAVQMTWR
jgi:hypothetical protein